MTANGWFQIGVFLLVIFAITKPMGVFMALATSLPACGWADARIPRQEN